MRFYTGRMFPAEYRNAIFIARHGSWNKTNKIGGDGHFTAQEYRMRFYAVGYAGYGPKTNNTQPKKYFFQYGSDHKSLNLFAR